MNVWQVVTFTDLEELPAICVRAEELGFAGISLGEHLFTFADQTQDYEYSQDASILWNPDTHWPDPWVAFGALSQITTTLRFMTSIYIVPLHDLFSAAKAISTAARMSNNRIILGAGIGWQQMEFEAANQDFKRRGARADEMLEIIQNLMNGDMVEYHGEFFDFPAVQMSPGTQEPVPIIIGGSSQHAFRRAARYQGWIGTQYEMDKIPDAIAVMKEERARQGRPDSEPWVHLVTYDDSDENLALMRSRGVTDLHRSSWLDEDGRAGRLPVEDKIDDMEAFARRVGLDPAL